MSHQEGTYMVTKCNVKLLGETLFLVTFPTYDQEGIYPVTKVDVKPLLDQSSQPFFNVWPGGTCPVINFVGKPPLDQSRQSPSKHMTEKVTTWSLRSMWSHHEIGEGGFLPTSYKEGIYTITNVAMKPPLGQSRQPHSQVSLGRYMSR